jgi:hypothetical protein
VGRILSVAVMIVTAVPQGLAEARANSQLKMQDNRIPQMEGAPDTVTGELEVVTVHSYWGVRQDYIVDGWNVDPASIVPAP